MIRGTTQPFKFTLPCKNTELAWVMVHFSQPSNPMLTPIIKTLDNCGPRDESNQLDGSNVLSVSLTSYDTAQFSDRYKAKMQMLAKPVNGVEFGVSEYLITVYPMPDDIIEADGVPVIQTGAWIVLDGKSIV
jgi:hypothetical protein